MKGGYRLVCLSVLPQNSCFSSIISKSEHEYLQRVGNTVISLKIRHERFAVFNFVDEFLEIKWKEIFKKFFHVTVKLESDLQLQDGEFLF